MNLSLNKIVESIAFSLGDQFNFTLRESLKDTIIYYREKLLREEDFNFSINYNYFNQKVILPLVEYENELGCTYLITEEVVPLPIRFKTRGRSNYNYVGDELRQHSYTLTTFEEYRYIKNLPFQMKTIYYTFDGGKLVILNNDKFCNVRIEGIFPDPRELQELCDNVEEVSDDAQFPISGDLLTTIKKGILSGDYPIRQMGEEGIIKSDSTDEN